MDKELVQTVGILNDALKSMPAFGSEAFDVFVKGAQMEYFSSLKITIIAIVVLAVLLVIGLVVAHSFYMDDAFAVFYIGITGFMLLIGFVTLAFLLKDYSIARNMPDYYAGIKLLRGLMW